VELKCPSRNTLLNYAVNWKPSPQVLETCWRFIAKSFPGWAVLRFLPGMIIRPKSAKRWLFYGSCSFAVSARDAQALRSPSELNHVCALQPA
jgi:hypothetical protein